MDDLGVPCPQCGSIEVVVGSMTEPPHEASTGEHDARHVPQLHRCSCKNCRHTFFHDFAFRS